MSFHSRSERTLISSCITMVLNTVQSTFGELFETLKCDFKFVLVTEFGRIVENLDTK